MTLAHLRYAARTFVRTPAVTTALLLTIAVGVGGNAAVHGFGRGLLARDAPSATTDRVLSVLSRDSLGMPGPVAWTDYKAVAGAPAFEWAGAVRELRATVQAGERTELLSVAAVTPELARVLDVAATDSVIVSREAWQLYLRAKADVRGERLRIDGREVVVKGIAPEWLEGLHVGRPIDVWMPLSDSALHVVDSTGRTLWVIARLARGASMGAVGETLQARSADGSALALQRYTGLMPELADGLARIQSLLTLAAGAVLLMVCANIAAFALGRASARSHETAIRIALGAGRRDIFTRLLADAVAIVLPGAMAGVIVAVWTSQLLSAFLFDSDAKALVFRPDIASVAAATGVSVAAMIACGLLPLVGARFDRPQGVLRRGADNATPATKRLHAGLVIIQVATCCALVIATGFLVEAFRGAVRAQGGARLGAALLATVQTSQDGSRYFHEIERELFNDHDGTSSVWVARPPGNGPSWQEMRIERPGLPMREVTMALDVFTPKMLDEIDLPPVAGRLFGGRDRPGGCPVAIVNRVAADTFFGGDAVGAAIVDASGRRIDVVGVVTTRVPSAVPAIWYYGDQWPVPPAYLGPQPFRVPADRAKARVVLDANIVSSAYFEGIGARIVAGGAFTPPPPAFGCRTAVVNAQAAERYFGGSALGGAVIDRLGLRSEIVGVIEPVALGQFDRRVEPSIYFHMDQSPSRRMTLIHDAGNTTQGTINALQGRLRRVRGGTSSPTIVPLDEHLGRTALAPLRIALLLVRAAATMAVVLAIAGTYGALAEAVRRRRREIGVRLALGARSLRVIGLVLAHAVALAAAGVVAGTISVLLARHAIVGQAPVSWYAWLSGPFVMLVAVALASIVPVAFALRVQPLEVLREE